MYKSEVDADQIKIYAQLLSHLDPAQLAAACEKVSKHFMPTAACGFPTPAHVLAAVENTAEAALELEINAEWKRVLDRVQWGGQIRGTLSQRTYRAAQEAGGFEVIESCPQSELQWRKKEFSENYKNLANVEDNPLLLGDSQAKRLLGQIAKRLKSGEKTDS